jgi:hypothetical protein
MEIDTMRQNETTTRKNLPTQLSTLHPSNIMGGVAIIRDFSINQFHGGTDPNGKAEHPIFTLAAEIAAYYSEPAPEAFPQLLKDYSELLTAFAAYLSTEGLSEASAQITRIQSALALEGATPPQAPARVSRWKDALACVVALCGAVLLEYTCSGKEWRHFVGLLALLMVAVPVWKLAASYGQRRALAPITQPTR